MKKTAIIISAILFTVLFLYELHLRNYYKNISEIELSKIDITDNDNTFDYEDETGNYHFRNPSIVNKSSDSVILSGCSFVFGYGIPYKDTFGFLLSDYTKYNVYNIAVCGGSPKELLYILKNKPMLKKILKPKASGKIRYFIYTYISAHDARLYYNTNRKSPNFRLKSGKLIYSKEKQLNVNLEMYPVIRNYINEHFIPKHKIFKLLTSYFEQINDEIKKEFGKDTKFVLLIYENDNNYNWKLLEEEGIKVIIIKDIVPYNMEEPQYRLWDNWHPSKKAWEVIVPKVAKELNL